MFLQDLSSVSQKYANAGYVQAEINEPNVVASPDGLVVTVRIEEGDQFRVGTLDVVGDDTVDIDGLRDLLQLTEGDIFNRSHLTQDVSSLTEHYTNRGFYFANVAPLSDLSPTDLAVDIVFQVRKGPLYFIRNVNVNGNTITIDPVVRRGDPYRPKVSSIHNARFCWPGRGCSRWASSKKWTSRCNRRTSLTRSTWT